MFFFFLQFCLSLYIGRYKLSREQKLTLSSPATFFTAGISEWRTSPLGPSGTVCLWPVIDNATQAALALVIGAWTSLRSREAGRSALRWSSVLSLCVAAEGGEKARGKNKGGKCCIIHINRAFFICSHLHFHILEGILIFKTWNIHF